MNIPNHCCLMVADDSWMTTSKWELIELQSKSLWEGLANDIVIVEGFGNER